MAEEQRLWAQARETYLTALQTYVDMNDQHRLGIVLGSLARLQQESDGLGLVAAVGTILGRSSDQVETLFKSVGSGQVDDSLFTPAEPPAGDAPSPGSPVPPPAQPATPPPQQEGVALDQLFDLVVQARQGDTRTGQQLHAAMQQLSADATQPAELRALADVLIRILVGEAAPDLSALPVALRQAVQGLLARLG